MPDLVSIVIPGYNEADHIHSTLECLSAFCRKHFSDYEIIFVDDGSTDQTWHIVDGYQDNPHLRAIRFSRNYGKGYAVRQGMLAATGQYRFFTDSDLPYDMECFLTGLNILKESSSDAVVGARNLPDSKDLAGLSRFRKLASILFSLLTNVFLKIQVKDSQCACKGFTAASAQQIFSKTRVNGFAFDVEIFLLAKKLGLKIKKIPVTLVNIRPSKVRLSRDPFRMLLDILKMSLWQRKGS